MKVSAVILMLLSATAMAADTTSPAPTPAATKPLRSCWDVSVEHDATYCIDGPICSGSGSQPAGWNCPKKGDVAVSDCYKYLKSWADAGKCVAPVDAECRVIKTGAWGCVWKGDSTGSGAVTPAPTVLTPAPTTVDVVETTRTPSPTKIPTSAPTTTPTSAPTTTPEVNDSDSSSGSGSSTIEIPIGSSSSDVEIPIDSSSSDVDDGETIQIPTSTSKTISLSASTATSTGTTDGSSNSGANTVGVIAAIAGVVCVITGAAIYRKRRNNGIQRQEATVDLESAIETPTYKKANTVNGGAAPQTPPVRDARRFFPTAQI